MQGLAAMRRYLGDWLETFDDITSVPTEVLDLGDDAVLAVLRVKGRARLSGIETELSYAVVYTVRNGKSFRVASMWTVRRPSRQWGWSRDCLGRRSRSCAKPRTAPDPLRARAAS